MEKYILDEIINKSKTLGADSADILVSESFSISISTRFTKLEEIIQAETLSADLRIFIGKRSAVVSTDNVSKLTDDSFIEKAISAAKNAPEESEISRAESHELCKNFKSIDIYDSSTISHENLLKDAQKCEEIALQMDGITNSNGAENDYVRTKFTLIRSDDFYGEYEKTRFGISVATLAEKGSDLQQSYAFSNAIYYSDLKTPEQVAKEAAEKTVKKLGARKIKSCKVPVIFDRNVSNQLLTSMLSALDGASIAIGTSFLKDKLFQKIFNDHLSIKDQYAISRGLRSRPFDSDGIECSDKYLVKNGELKTFLLNKKYANKLKMESTGNAVGYGSIAPNNVCIENGNISLQDMLKSVSKGLYITEVLGVGLNTVTGNVSQGAVGFWIENGCISYPVHEITIAGNFIDMFSNCIIGSDLKIETGIDAPSILVEQMTIGGI